MKKFKQILSGILAVGMFTFSAPMGVFAEEARTSPMPTGTPVTASGNAYSIMPLAAGDVAINETNFPDANFRNYVTDNCDTNKNGALSTAEITAVTRIDVYSKGISNLKGVEHFTALTDLDCSYNVLTSLDVSGNTALTELDCRYNELGSLDVSANTKLTKLYCVDNQLTSLDVSENTALTYLSCSDNQFTSLDVSANTALTYLSCSDNQLTSLDVSANTKLTKLYCSHNQLTNLDVSKNTSLTIFGCEINQLTNLDVSANTKLTKLYCVDNQLTSLNVSENTSLTHLWCYNNQLTSLDVSENTSLTELYCFNNTYNIGNICGSYALSKLPGNFDVTKASDWTGASCTDGILSGFTVGADGKFTVTYTYDMGNSKSETFTLKGTKTEHSYDQTVANDDYLKSPATCTAPATYYKSCICGEASATETFTVGEALGHDFGEWTKLDGNVHIKNCKRTGCDYSETESHSYGEWITVTPATEDSEGLKKHICGICQYEETAIIPKADHVHAYGAEWKYNDTEHWHVCKCGEKSDIANHTWDNGTVTTEPTYDTEGEKTYTCTVCEATKTEAIPKLDKPTPPTGGGSGTTTSPQPFVKEDTSIRGWSKISDTIENSDKGDVINIDMNGAEILQSFILDDMAGKDITVTFDMGNVTWIIRGKDVPAGKHSYVDLAVKVGTKNIPTSLIGKEKAVQISLDHDGEFGFTATLSINLGKENADKFANLYYYDKSGKKLDFISQSKIDKDGKALIEFTHASDYAIIIRENGDITLGEGYEEVPAEPIKFD